jgi:hypothetical protein
VFPVETTMRKLYHYSGGVSSRSGSENIKQSASVNVCTYVRALTRPMQCSRRENLWPLGYVYSLGRILLCVYHNQRRCLNLDRIQVHHFSPSWLITNLIRHTHGRPQTFF